MFSKHNFIFINGVLFSHWLKAASIGFELAEKDLQLRGPGEILGTRQSGQVVTRLADLAHHKDMLPLARNVAEDLLARRLSAQQYGAIEWLLRVFRKDDAARLLKAG